MASAEDYLLRAARVSRLYEPRWTLANFYFRRGARAEFWNWTRQALELAPRDGTPQFQLCWAMSQDPEEILRKAIPPNPRVVESYASFLLSTNRLDAAAQLFAGSARQAQVPLLLSACDRFIDAAMIDAAVSAWNAAVGSNALDPERGASLTNAAFAVPATGRGFDWRVRQIPGVSATIGSGVAAVFFDGREPEQCEPIAQLIPVLPGRKYQLQFEYKSTGIPPQSGLKWQAAAACGGSNSMPLANVRGSVGTAACTEPRPSGSGVAVCCHKLLGSSASLSSDDWKQEVVEFQAPQGVRLVRLSLIYSRASGAVRIDGSAVTRAMRLL